jgi:DNA-binding response OmpR family regulator
MEQWSIIYRILVVDDEPSICQGLARGLLSKDYEVDVADTGLTAIEKASQKKYDILIADLYLPDMLGTDVIRQFREQNPQIISILITAYPTRESGILAKHLGVSDCLEKPFDIQRVKDAIVQGIANRDLPDTQWCEALPGNG